MIRLSSTYLGLSLSDKAIACGELIVNGDQRTIRRTATFALPQDFTYEKPVATGQALASFLRQHKFRASKAVVGVPARWLLAVDREVPPSGLEQAHSILRLHAERLGVGENGEMVFDYSGRLEAARGGKVLLVGILRQQLERIESFLESAGVSIIAVTPTALALSAGMAGGTDQPMLLLGSQGAELIWQNAENPRLLRHIPVTSLNGHGVPAVGPLGAELRRTVSLAPGDGGGAAREVLLLDGLGLSDEQRGELSGRAGVSVRDCDGLDSLGIRLDPDAEKSADTNPIESFVPALALALAGARQVALPLDFRRSRLTPPRQKRVGRRTFWMVALGATAVIGIGSLAWSMQQRQGELDRMKNQHQSMESDVKAASEMLAEFKIARGYFDARRGTLDCLREITLAFSDDDPIWVTNLNLHENGKGTLAGKAEDSKAILALCGRLQKNKKFTDVRTLQISEVNVPGGRYKEQSFSIGFTFLKPE